MGFVIKQQTTGKLLDLVGPAFHLTFRMSIYIYIYIYTVDIYYIYMYTFIISVTPRCLIVHVRTITTKFRWHRSYVFMSWHSSSSLGSPLVWNRRMNHIPNNYEHNENQEKTMNAISSKCRQNRQETRYSKIRHNILWKY